MSAQTSFDRSAPFLTPSRATIEDRFSQWRPAVASASITLEPNGEIADAGWALARLNDGSSSSEIQSFAYPETSTRVRLYLIDTAVKYTSGWFEKNPKLAFKGTTRTYSKPTASKSFIHGTRMLGVIAGPETGAAQGTPIDVVNYDVYPGVEPTNTTAGQICSAISKAYIHYLTTTPRLPSVICIAAGSTTPETDYIMEDYINTVVQEGITVVVSAGNQSADASAYIPASYGKQAGVICVGATGKNNQRLPMSNYGSAVDLYAPGEDVRTLRYSSPKSGFYDLMDGTSPAAALTTAAALIKLSQNPALTPVQLEQALVADAYTSVAPAALVQVAPPVPELDTDGDGAADVLENFFGSNSSDATSKPAAPTISLANGQASLSFKVAATSFKSESPYSVAGGGTWKVQVSNDLIAWQDVSAPLIQGATADGKTTLSVSVPVGPEANFLRVEVKGPEAE
ncbi:S8 family serine peptidase [Luteolibacter luteus]|uniref:S8 family serine peptidase n=1 Tax=Luteolibacter luteus TaxID=2728835 RepID=A0A858RDZ7_9BACT|nr:S8 family serine peptidase [Luteolibacter luteus]QJE94794.1 S8 family serine peptidase [Luteolibacter luteus]